jgi:hypothetical protein
MSALLKEGEELLPNFRTAEDWGMRCHGTD